MRFSIRRYVVPGVGVLVVHGAVHEHLVERGTRCARGSRGIRARPAATPAGPARATHAWASSTGSASASHPARQVAPRVFSTLGAQAIQVRRGVRKSAKSSSHWPGEGLGVAEARGRSRRGGGSRRGTARSRARTRERRRRAGRRSSSAGRVPTRSDAGTGRDRRRPARLDSRRALSQAVGRATPMRGSAAIAAS